MAYQKLQVSEALAVIPGAVRIPDTNTVVVLDTATGSTAGNADFSAANTLTAVGTKFTEVGILPGAIIYNLTALEAYYVVSVDSDTQLTLSAGGVGGGADQYSIYTQPTKGCILFVGTGGTVEIQMAQQNGNIPPASINYINEFKNIGSGCFMPTQVVRVGGRSTATDIIALW
jgi:hypothetical protein